MLFYNRLGILLIAMAVIGCQSSPNPPARPNIVFIMADDLGLSDINSFDQLGRSYYETPNIDRLGREGMKFMQAYTSAANCAPTRAGLVSGQYYPNQPIYHVGNSGRGAMIPARNAHSLPLEKITEAEMLRNAGYATALIGKWHLGDPPEAGPMQQGYEVNIGGYSAGNPVDWEGGYFEPNNNPFISDAREGEYLTDYLTRKAIEYIGTPRENPFYLNLSYYTPHSPFQAPEELVDKYREKEPEQGHGHPVYAAMIEVLDRNVGRLMDALDRLEMDQNTLVIFYSDNGGRGGYGFLGHGNTDITDNSPLKGGKGTFFEGGIRVPLIMRWPAKIAAGSVTHEPVTTIDFYPTYLNLSGSEPQEGHRLDGKSLVPLIENPAVSLEREAIYWHFPGYPNSPWRTTPVSVIRSGPWKLMKFYESDDYRLYNLTEDPGEEHNLAGEAPEVRDRLAGDLENWLEENDAPLPRWPDE